MCLAFGLSVSTALAGCKKPVVFEGLEPDSALTTFESPVAADDVAALVRHHARAALAASASGRMDEARAHWEAHEALRALVGDEDVDPGVDPRELQSLAELLQAEEIEAERAEGRAAGPLVASARTVVTASVGVAPVALPVSTVAPGASRPPEDAAEPADWLDAEVRRILADFGESRKVDLPKTFIANVERAVADFTEGSRRRWFGRALQRMDKYLPTIHGIFSERRLPESLYYVALVESAFNPNARSRAGAVGLWQFMPATARQYGLTVRRGLDERRDPRKATRAAREYLLDLILEFGDGHSMLLAIAAYNAGEGRVRNRLRRLRDYRNRSFWTLAERRLLPSETRRYVPTIIAAAVVGRNRGRFGMRATPPKEGVATVELRRPVSIPYVLKAAKMAEAQLLALNPDLEKGGGVTPADTRFQLVLPTEIAERLQNDPVLLAAQRPPPPRPAPPQQRSTGATRAEGERYLTYRVQRNDSWWTISEWSGVPQLRLRRDNPRVADRGLQPGQVVYIRGLAENVRRFLHTVEPGETLSKIARMYGVAERHLKQWNGLRGSRLRVGQKLAVYADRAPTIEASDPSPARLSYRVQPNDTWWKISRWSGVAPDQLRRDNPGVDEVGLQPGQTVHINGAHQDLQKVEHVVRAGETLAQIADRYGVESEQIAHWNGLQGAAVSAGQSLVVYVRRPRTSAYRPVPD